MATYSWPLTVENVRQAGINCDLNNVALSDGYGTIDQDIQDTYRSKNLFEEEKKK